MDKLFITGASGCIGHYLLNHLQGRTDLEIHVLLRNPSRLQVNQDLFPHLHLHVGEIEHIETFKDLIHTMTHIVHIATVWNNSDHSIFINKEKTHELFSFCNPDILKKIVYFSTASILGPGNTPVKAADDFGTGYVQSKYLAFMSLPESPVYDKIVTVFPTLVFGGDANHPYSHISSGIQPNLHYAKILRFFDVDASFHFLHAYDISAVALHALFNDTPKELVLGQSVITANDAFATICKVFNIPIYFRIPIRPWFVFLLAKLFRIEIQPWDRYCITHPHMVYDTVNPEHFGLTSKYPTLSSLIEELAQESS